MIVTLLVGKFSDIGIDRLISSYKNEFPIVISTWSDQVQEDHIQVLEKANFDLVLSDMDKSKDFSINYQLKTIRKGLDFINKKYKCDIIIKSRLDIYPINYDKMISYIKSVSFEDNKLLVLYKVYIELLYYLDLIIIGKKDNINRLFNIEDSKSNVYPELYLIDNYSGYVPKNYTQEYYERYFKFIGQKLKYEDIDFVWERNKENFDKMPMNFLSDYKDRIEKEDYSVHLIRDFSIAPYIS